MITIHYITLGKLKERFWREAEAEYVKRLQPWAKIIVHELREESFGSKDNPDSIKNKEASKIETELTKISAAFVVVLDEHGAKYSSIQFSEKLTAITTTQNNHVVFVIGGPLGLSESIRQRAELLLSLSSFTFTHQMARVILLEQIYRAMMIANGRTYHY